ncbi:MAG: TetR/AcrR family transcriptional regulator [Pseudonocardia sp.]
MTADRRAERRLSADARRAQLAEAAFAMLGERPYDPLTHEGLAARVGVSKPLVFHYFPTVGDLRLAVLEQLGADLMQRLSRSGADRSLPERLRAGIEGFIDSAEHHADVYLLLFRGGASDERMLAAMHATRDQMARLVGSWAGIESPPASVMVVIRGYLGMVEEAVLQWLPDRPIPRAVLVEFLTEALGRMQDQADRLLERAEPGTGVVGPRPEPTRPIRFEGAR